MKKPRDDGAGWWRVPPKLDRAAARVKELVDEGRTFGSALAIAAAENDVELRVLVELFE